MPRIGLSTDRIKGIPWAPTVVFLLLIVSACREDGTAPGTGGTGSLAVAATTAGDSPDPDGYQLVVDGQARGPIDANGSRTLQVPIGEHSVALAGVATNCTIPAGNTRTVTVTASQTASVTYAVDCPRPVGTLIVEVLTQGALPDPDGYAFTVDGGAPLAAAPNDTIAFAGVPFGRRTLTISGQAANCVPVGPAARSVAIPANGITTRQVVVTCFRDPIVFERASYTVDLWVIEADGSFEVNLTDGVGSSRLEYTAVPAAAWNADRTELLFTSDRDGDLDVYRMALNKSTLVQYDRPTDQLESTWSPDGTRVMFASSELGDIDVWTTDADGGNAVRASNSTFVERHHTWHPEGDRVTYVRIDGDFRELFIADVDGGNVRNLSNLPRTSTAIHDYYAYWTPDGSQYAFKRVAFDISTRALAFVDLYVADSTGGNLRNLTNFTVEMPDFSLAWDPTGTRLAFTMCDSRSNTTNCVIHTIGIDGAGLTMVSGSGTFDDSPSWSPGFTFEGPRAAGERLVFSCQDAGGNWELCVADADGGNFAFLTDTEALELVPKWR